MLRFIKTDVVGTRSGKELCDINVRDTKNLWELTDVEIGQAIQKALNTLIKKEQHKRLLMEMRSFFMCSVEYLQKSLPLGNRLLSDLKRLQPSLRDNVESETVIRNFTVAVPHVVSDEKLSLVTDEWKRYALDDIPSDSALQAHNVDQYWARVFNRRNAVGQSCQGLSCIVAWQQ